MKKKNPFNLNKTKPKKPRVNVPVERPTLVDLINKVAGELNGQVKNIRWWNELFYLMATQPTPPKCLVELTWHERKGYKRSEDLCDTIAFMMALGADQKIQGDYNL